MILRALLLAIATYLLLYAWKLYGPVWVSREGWEPMTEPWGHRVS